MPLIQWQGGRLQRDIVCNQNGWDKRWEWGASDNFIACVELTLQLMFPRKIGRWISAQTAAVDLPPSRPRWCALEDDAFFPLILGVDITGVVSSVKRSCVDIQPPQSTNSYLEVANNRPVWDLPYVCLALKGPFSRERGGAETWGFHESPSYPHMYCFLVWMERKNGI